MDSTDNSSGKNYVLIAATLGSFLSPFMGSAINVALPSIGAELQMDAVLLGWVATAYLIAAAVFLVPFGRLADIHGRKRVFTYGILVYTLASLLSAIATSGAMLISFRVLQGVGAAMMFGTGVAIITSVFPPGERGRALGINVAAVYIGLSLGPFLGGLLTEHFGWRSVFIANVPMGIAVLALIVWKLKGEWATARGEGFDLRGALIYAASLVLIMYGFSELPDWHAGLLIGGGAAALVVFVLRESSLVHPLLDIALFRHNAVFAFSNLAALINYSATFAIAFLLSLYLQYNQGLSAQSAGFVLVAQPAVQAIFSPIAGRLSDRFEPRIIASTGMALTVVGLALFAMLSDNTPLSSIVAGLVLLGFGLALFSSPNTNAVMSSVEARRYGVAGAMLATMRQLGMMLSMGIAMLLFAVYIGRVEITPEYYDEFLTSARVAFGVFAALCFIGVFASLARGKVRREPT